MLYKHYKEHNGNFVYPEWELPFCWDSWFQECGDKISDLVQEYVSWEAFNDKVSYSWNDFPHETSSGYKFWDAYELQKGYWWHAFGICDEGTNDVKWIIVVYIRINNKNKPYKTDYTFDATDNVIKKLNGDTFHALMPKGARRPKNNGLVWVC
ncbi:hypothetical protein SPFM12_00148 [Salmonella phage SPFM12]|nr:hypothetical protein SPFM12_00148 [Salmonella phage SPFM12]